MAKVKAVCISEKKGTVKKAVEQIECIENHGLLGDAHAGNWHRQVSLMSLKDIEECGQDYPSLEYGVYAENILIDDERIRYLPLGSRIHIQDVILEVTQIGKECHSGCIIQQKTGKCLMPQIGIFTKVIHGGMIHKNDEVTFEIPQKLERQNQLFTSDEQEKIFKQEVIIVGLGGLGQIVAEQLVRLGFRHLTLVDHDRISYSNFNRQIYANTQTIHLFKTLITREKLLEIEPLCQIQTYEITLDKNTPLDIIPENSIIVDCCDHIPTKLLLEDIIQIKDIPLIHGAMDGWHGQVTTLLPQDHLLSKLYLNQNLKTHDSLVMTAHLVASFQVKEIIQMTLHKTPNLHHQILWIDALNNDIQITKL